MPGSFIDRSQAQPFDQPPQTFIFSDLPPAEKVRFMEFLLTNQVEFQLDPTDQTYTATIKIVDNNDHPLGQRREPEQEIISGLEQMRQLQNYESQAFADMPVHNNNSYRRFNSSPDRRMDTAVILKN